MSTQVQGVSAAPAVAAPATHARPLHRIGYIRRREGLSLRGIARKLRKEIRELRRQEDEATDLRLSDLYQWQQILEVPVADLLVDADEELSQPVLRRAQFVRLMKTVRSLLDATEGQPRIQRMTTMLAEQLEEVMPELHGIGPWPSVGQRRTLDEFGRAADHAVGPELTSIIERAS